MSNYTLILKCSRKLRKKQTWEEAIVWDLVRNRRLLNLKFTRQLPIIYNRVKQLYVYVVDFYCHEKKLVLEIDGKIHEFQKEYDCERDAIINEMGIKVVRIKNDQTKDRAELKRKLMEIVRSI